MCAWWPGGCLPPKPWAGSRARNQAPGLVGAPPLYGASVMDPSSSWPQMPRGRPCPLLPLAPRRHLGWYLGVQPAGLIKPPSVFLAGLMGAYPEVTHPGASAGTRSLPLLSIFLCPVGGIPEPLGKGVPQQVTINPRTPGSHWAGARLGTDDQQRGYSQGDRGAGLSGGK